MIETFETLIGQSVKMTELYSYLEMDKGQYSRFCKQELDNSPYFDEGKDYIVAGKIVTGKVGKPSMEYHIHIDTAKKICMVSRSHKGNEIRNMLVEITKKVESLQLMTTKQFMELQRLVKVLSIYRFRKKAKDQHKEVFIDKHKKGKEEIGDICKEFEIWRNEILHCGKEELCKRILEICKIERKKIPMQKTLDNVDSMLLWLKEYEEIRNAVWDILSSRELSNELKKNIALMAQELAEEMELFCTKVGESEYGLYTEKITHKDIEATFNKDLSTKLISKYP